MRQASYRAGILLLCLAGCSGETPPPASDAAVATAPSGAAAPAAPAAVPVPAGDPPADVVRALAFEQYAELEKAGPMPATVSATGRSLQLRAKLFEARKEECHPVPQQPAGEFECTLTIKVAMTGDGSDPALEEPSEQGDRLFISWDAANGRWVRSSSLRDR